MDRWIAGWAAEVEAGLRDTGAAEIPGVGRFRFGYTPPPSARPAGIRFDPDPDPDPRWRRALAHGPRAVDPLGSFAWPAAPPAAFRVRPGVWRPLDRPALRYASDPALVAALHVARVRADTIPEAVLVRNPTFRWLVPGGRLSGIVRRVWDGTDTDVDWDALADVCAHPPDGHRLLPFLLERASPARRRRLVAIGAALARSGDLARYLPALRATATALLPLAAPLDVGPLLAALAELSNRPKLADQLAFLDVSGGQPHGDCRRCGDTFPLVLGAPVSALDPIATAANRAGHPWWGAVIDASIAARCPQCSGADAPVAHLGALGSGSRA